MTQSQLREQLWCELPLVRKSIVGRERVDDIITIAIEQSPIEFCRHISRGSIEQDVVLAAWGQSVKRGYCLIYGEEAQFGPLFWLVVGPIVQIILQKLLDWWFASRSHRILLEGWRRELTK